MAIAGLTVRPVAEARGVRNPPGHTSIDMLPLRLVRRKELPPVLEFRCETVAGSSKQVF
jgi:hypothetical protein